MMILNKITKRLKIHFEKELKYSRLNMKVKKSDLARCCDFKTIVIFIYLFIYLYRY